jgi:phosphonopyruvate decarboxylase
MGYAVAVGCGVALHVKNRVVVVDGDGSALMHMGNLATVGATCPRNLIHIVLDNGVHDSTGGQPTMSASVDFCRIALACSYATAWTCDSERGFAEALASALNSPGPHFVHVLISPGSFSPLPRPAITLPDLAARFSSFLSPA